MEIIVGSTALSYFGMNRREPSDMDVWTDEKEYVGLGVDSHYMPTEIFNLLSVQSLQHGYITPDESYTIKCSHAAWDIHWDKTKLDILWLKALGCKLIPELYKALVEIWKVEHGNKEFLSLSKNKEDFFDDNVTYVYDHDYLHELVAYHNTPVYSKVLQDGQQVLIDKDKFDKLPHSEKVRMFREEIAVIACERWVLNPHWQGNVSWYRAHIFSVRKTVTRLTKGKFCEFLIMHLEEFVKPDYTYYKHILEVLDTK